jgi:hypothetical protein
METKWKQIALKRSGAPINILTFIKGRSLRGRHSSNRKPFVVTNAYVAPPMKNALKVVVAR